MAASRLTNDDKLKRLLYLSNLEGKYTCGDQHKFVSDTEEKRELIKYYTKNAESLLRVLTLINNDDIPDRSKIYHVLALVMKSAGDLEINEAKNIKCLISNLVLQTHKSDEEIFDFVKYVSFVKINKHIPKTVTKLVKKYYKSKSPLELAKCYAKFTSKHKWAHKDLIKLSHVKPETPLKGMVINYILFKKINEIEEDDALRNVSTIMQKSDQLRKTTDHNVAVPIITELKATISQVGPHLRKSAEVWNAVIPNMALSQILKVLPKLYKRGFLKKGTSTLAVINETLTNPERVKASGIHPWEVFVHLKNLERGGKGIDPKLLEYLLAKKKLTEEKAQQLKTQQETKSCFVLNTLHKCMKLACQNVHVTQKRFLVTVDVTRKMGSKCVGSRNVTALEAASAFVWFLLKVEKDVTVAVYKQKEISVVHVDRKLTIHEIAQLFEGHKCDFLLPAAPIEWATSGKKHFDVFVNFIHHHEYLTAVPNELKGKFAKPAQSMLKYRERVNLMYSKLVTISVSTIRLNFTEGSVNMLDVAGLSSAVPRLVDAFIRGHFW